MQTRSSNAILARQPIFDRSHRAIAHELLYRTGDDHGEARVTDGASATAHVSELAFRRWGVRSVVGQSKAYINIDADFLLSRMIETLPPDRVVLEILETVDIDERILSRCRQLKARGYSMALDDFVYRETTYSLLDIVDVVKIDVLKTDRMALSEIVTRLRFHPVALLAEKIDSIEKAVEARSLGFDLFQGFYFGRPTILSA